MRQLHQPAEVAEPARASARGELRERKRERILDAAAALFFQQGYRATSMESIAEQLGVTKPFLYYHFENKHEILEEIARRVLLQLRSVMERASEQASAPEQALEACVRGYLAIFLGQRSTARVLFREALSLSERTRALLRAEHEAHVACLGEICRDGVEQGVFRVEEPTLAAAAILRLLSLEEPFSLHAVPEHSDWLVTHYVRLAFRVVGALREPAGD